MKDKDNEIIKTLAEFEGWEDIIFEADPRGLATKPISIEDGSVFQCVELLPDYLNDLNVIHELECELMDEIGLGELEEHLEKAANSHQSGQLPFFASAKTRALACYNAIKELNNNE